MNLFDALYINSFGGKTILEGIINQLILKNREDYFFIFDSRLDPIVYSNITDENYIILHPKEKDRKQYYLKNKDDFNSFICLSNIPPPIRIKDKNVFILFHNVLFLESFNKNKPLNFVFLNFLKRQYIILKKQNNYNWITQSYLVRKKLSDSFQIYKNQISVFPIFKEEFLSFTKEKCTNDFVYVSSGASHKNHKRLIKAFISAAIKTNMEIKLHLTLSKDELPRYVLPKNLKIEFHGTLSIDAVNELYNSCEFAIYPSLVESFGLPLIEASNHNCKVIASNLPYVHEIIKPSITFDPYSVESISNSILKATETDNLPETKVLVENKLDNFVDFIISQDVQK